MWTSDGTVGVGALGHERVEEVVTATTFGSIPPVRAAIDHLFHGL
jgi:hypothetical protein